jgi:hypothetical protein
MRFLIKHNKDPKSSVSMVQVASHNPFPCYWNSKNRSQEICFAVNMQREVKKCPKYGKLQFLNWPLSIQHVKKGQKNLMRLSLLF